MPAEPQQKCPSGTSSTSNPAARSSARGWRRSRVWPCCSEQAIVIGDAIGRAAVGGSQADGRQELGDVAGERGRSAAPAASARARTDGRSP